MVFICPVSEMPFRACSFCKNTTKNCQSKSILKLDKYMLEQLGVTGSYYTCTDHLKLGEDSVRVGSRKRWRGDQDFHTDAPFDLLGHSYGYQGDLDAESDEEEEEQSEEEEDDAVGGQEEEVVVVPQFLSSSPVIDTRDTSSENSQQESWSQVWTYTFFFLS